VLADVPAHERQLLQRSHFGSPHGALELPGQAVVLSGLFICQKG
jgi:hypothetical protein